MPKYNVFLSPEVRVKISNIEANSQEEAIVEAEDWFSQSDVPQVLHDAVLVKPSEARVSETEPYVEHIELSEDLSDCLVDVVGDEDFSESCWYSHSGPLGNDAGWKPANEMRVLVLTASNEMGREENDQVLGVFRNKNQLAERVKELYTNDKTTKVDVSIDVNGWVFAWVTYNFPEEEDAVKLKVGYITHSLVQ